MPEGPEVRVIAQGLNRELQNCFLLEIRVDPSISRYSEPPCQIPPQGIKVLQVLAHGKRILFLCTGQVLVSFLGMEGKWQRERGKHSGLELRFARTLCEEPPILTTFSLFFDDSRHFGALQSFTSESQLDAFFSTLGPDLLSPGEVPLHLWIRRLRAHAKKEVGQVLLDQHVVSGIGNYLRAEILYISHISPFRTVQELSDEELSRLWRVSLDTIQKAYECGGLTIRSYWDLEGNRGTFPIQIYGKDTDPHGHPVESRMDASKRRIWWVPAVQK